MMDSSRLSSALNYSRAPLESLKQAILEQPRLSIIDYWELAVLCHKLDQPGEAIEYLFQLDKESTDESIMNASDSLKRVISLTYGAALIAQNKGG